MTTRRLRFGIKTAPQHTTYDDILRVWQEADAIPIVEHAWVFDHFVPLGPNPAGPCLEGWTLLAALAARTDRVRVVARHAAIWNFAGGPVEEFQRKNAVLDGHCATIGRDPATIERSVQVRVDPADLGAVRATLRSFIDVGATHLILNLLAPYPEG